MDKRPLVSIGMPVYNGEKYIRKAVESLLAQDYENFELIISDNASTDATPAICREYASRDPRVRLHAHDRNVGGLANFEKVLELAQGPYFMWAAVDDYWDERFVSSMVGQLEAHPEAGVAMSGVELFNEDGLPVGKVAFGGANDPNRKGHFRMFMAVCSPVKKKYNFYIYGLFRTELLRGTFASVPRVINMDRIFVAFVSLVTRLRYVDAPLQGRTVRNKMRTRAGADQLSELAEIRKLGGIIWRSPLVPLRRKLYLPAGMVSLGLLSLVTRYRARLRPKLARFWHKLRGHSPSSRGANVN